MTSSRRKTNVNHSSKNPKSTTPQTPNNQPVTPKNLPKIIFFGNGLLATSTLATLKPASNLLFHARTAADLDEVIRLKSQHPDTFGILASFGVLLPDQILELFEPTGGIINLHPSKLPLYRGPSPIESAILAGDTDFSYSIMKLTSACDAGPIYHQATLKDLPLDKSAIYHSLATAGATWLLEHLNHLPTPTPQDNAKATYTKKLSKADSLLEPSKFPASTILRQIIAYQTYPKPKYEFFGQTCIILAAHTLRVTDILCEAAGLDGTKSSPLMLKCADRNFVVIDRLQPAGKKPMNAISFYNGYGHHQPNKNSNKNQQPSSASKISKPQQPYQNSKSSDNESPDDLPDLDQLFSD